MKLHYLPGACSLASHIVLRECDEKFELSKLDRETKKTADGRDYLKINPNGYVPSLELESGDVLTEGPAIMQYLADGHPETHLAPAWGTMERYRMLEWLNFITSELHKSYSPLFRPTTPDAYKKMVLESLTTRLGYVATRLDRTRYLLGDNLSVADFYLFVILGWARRLGPDLAAFPSLQRFRAEILKRPAVQAAMQAEGLKTE